jgi:MFS family permease
MDVVLESKPQTSIDKIESMIDPEDKKNGWLYGVLSSQIAYSPISTIIALYILYLHGTVIDVSYAFTVSNAVMIPAGILWGKMIDKYARRKMFILISFASLAISLLSLFFVSNVFYVIAIYGVLSFMFVASATPLNLLVMEKNHESYWAKGFSKLQLFASLGGTVGLLVATIAAGFVHLNYIMLILFAFAALSVLLTTATITEHAAKFTRKSLIGYIYAFRSRLFLVPLFFARIPRIRIIKEILRKFLSFKIPRKSQMNLIYTGSLFFYLGSGLFNTVYSAGLKESGMSNFLVFVVILVSMVVQTTAFYISGGFTNKRGEVKTISRSLYLRGSSYLLIGASFVVLSSVGLLGVNLLLYALAAGIGYALFYTASNTLLFRAIKTWHPARALGIYSGFTGFSTLIGSLISGYISFYVGYWFTFSIAGVLVLLSAVAFGEIKKLGS